MAYEKKLAKLERILASACSALERNGYNFAENHDLDRWWIEHKELRAITELIENKKIEYIKEILKKPMAELTKDEWDLIRTHEKQHTKTKIDTVNE